MRHLICAALLAASPAMADMVLRTPVGDELRLTEEACTNAAVLGNLKPEWRDKFKRARAVVGGTVFEACYIDTMQGAYYIAFSDGDQSTLPITAFIQE